MAVGVNTTDNLIEILLLIRGVEAPCVYDKVFLVVDYRIVDFAAAGDLNPYICKV